ncbi:4-hydroxy-tetrahydrodipicolinate reductase [Ammoniphilus sp. CFH 90114]|uniref:4-hydroxy-tetrahydrodipicolinate reductase n=1 Tax=Ammoniphilus sp. CFH 90114 TaxID=2493665 RepID=UPI00100F5507|nr:4-hydroxy-tetrahydrodipicolinate reductase [Ammoniphilus sp. CFH 90114]RXT13938.1 4-hydroxy-tetrahydrodipicolinate reductase [Ammoniphilus sp. CFH 90114]
MDMSIRVVVTGSKGRMGQEAVKMVMADPELELVAEVGSPRSGGEGASFSGVPFLTSLEEALLAYKPDVLVDLTTPHVVKSHMELAILHGVRPVVGTTGLSTEDIEELDKLCREKGVGAIIAPNFAIGAILMMKFAREAARYMPHVEIIELHHDKKLDAPSGTAVKTAELIQQTRQELKQGHPDEEEIIDGARGGYYHGFRIHSVRLPGLVAHQEVLFGHVGQTLSIRHDSMNRESFMPGINLGIKKVLKLDRLVYGLENVMD